jgi:hypothetical protein
MEHCWHHTVDWMPDGGYIQHVSSSLLREISFPRHFYQGLLYWLDIIRGCRTANKNKLLPANGSSALFLGQHPTVTACTMDLSGRCMQILHGNIAGRVELYSAAVWQVWSRGYKRQASTCPGRPFASISGGGDLEACSSPCSSLSSRRWPSVISERQGR